MSQAYRVRLTQEAGEDLKSIFEFVENRASSQIARSFIQRLLTFIGKLDFLLIAAHCEMMSEKAYASSVSSAG